MGRFAGRDRVDHRRLNVEVIEGDLENSEPRTVVDVSRIGWQGNTHSARRAMGQHGDAPLATHVTILLCVYGPNVRFCSTAFQNLRSRLGKTPRRRTGPST